MSQLDELIAEFCPNGVEYKTIDEIAVDIYRGSGIKRDQVKILYHLGWRMSKDI